jgi:hypothetical protein
MRKDVKTDVFDVIYFHDADRIAREVTIQTIIIEEILKHRKQLIINGKDYVKNPENKFTLSVLGRWGKHLRLALHHTVPLLLAAP